MATIDISFNLLKVINKVPVCERMMLPASDRAETGADFHAANRRQASGPLAFCFFVKYISGFCKARLVPVGVRSLCAVKAWGDATDRATRIHYFERTVEWQQDATKVTLTAQARHDDID
ncbi:MAG: hypothetical protein K9N51_04530 [Candidatus Pacebacteria bacterium]|nr:hypothetical protein [Candidatus Paceibacterota bacterium]